MTAPIEDVSSLPGRKVTDQAGVPIGEVKDIYAIDGDGYPMWVAVEASLGGMNDKRTVFIPLARLKDEDGELRVPYTKNRIIDTPEVDGSDGISPECDRKLRDHYGIGTGDGEMYSDKSPTPRSSPRRRAQPSGSRMSTSWRHRMPTRGPTRPRSACRTSAALRHATSTLGQSRIRTRRTAAAARPRTTSPLQYLIEA